MRTSTPRIIGSVNAKFSIDCNLDSHHEELLSVIQLCRRIADRFSKLTDVVPSGKVIDVKSCWRRCLFHLMNEDEENQFADNNNNSNRRD